jgi:hypothetical protein
MRWSAILGASVLLLGQQAFAKPFPAFLSPPQANAAGCAAGSYSVVNAPDGSSVSVLFDGFSVKRTAAQSGAAVATCALEIPLNLPEGYSLGVYRIEYRGFAHLAAGQSAQLSVDYGLGPHSRSRRYHRGIRGAFEGDYSFTENIGSGLMKRVGCGEAATLNFAATLALEDGGNAGEGVLALDSSDGAPKGGLIFHLDRRKCSTK